MKNLAALVRSIYAATFNSNHGVDSRRLKSSRHRSFTLESLETRLLLSADPVALLESISPPEPMDGQVVLLLTGEDPGADTTDDETYIPFSPWDPDVFVKPVLEGPGGGGGVVETLPSPADVLTNNNSGATGTANFTQSETTVLAFGSTVLVGYNDSGSAGTPMKFTGFSRSTDGGATFTDGGTLPTNPGGDGGDPVLARNDTTGRVYYSTLGPTGTGTIRMFRSDDGGATWMDPVDATPGGTGEDKQWHTVDNFDGPGNGNVYLVSRRFGGTAPGIYFFRSTDNGDTFGPTGGTLIVGGSQGAFVNVAPDHSVYVFWFAGTTIQMRKSTDFGVTFGAPVIVASGLVGGGNGDLALTGIRQGTATPSGFRSNEFPHAAINPVSGDIYVTYNNDGPGADKADVYVVQSTTGGTTWSAPVKVNDDLTTTDQWQPTLAVNPAGDRLGVFYYSRQEDPAGNNLFKYYGRIANISGSTLTFTPSFAVSDRASLPEFGRDSRVNPVYMGDYDTASATPEGFAVTWSDSRDDLPGGAGRKDPNVYFRMIDLGLAVRTTSPAVGSVVSTIPINYVVNFNDPIDFATLDAADFMVDGVVADSFVENSPTQVTFQFLTAPFSTQGLHTMTMAAGAILRASDSDGLAAFSGTFRYDAVLLQVTSTVPPVGGLFILPGPFTYDVNFNEAIDPASIQTWDLVLSGITGAVVSAVTVLPGNTTARFTLSGITAQGILTATMMAGGITDAFGNPNGAFTGSESVDIIVAPFPTPLTVKNPQGSLIYDPIQPGVITFAGDTDTFTLNVDPGQTITVKVTPVPAPFMVLQPNIQLIDPFGATIAQGNAGAAGTNAIIQTVPAIAGGTYQIVVSGVGVTIGSYTAQVILNAALEREGNILGVTNNAVGTAQAIDSSFLTVSTPQASAQRGAVLGQTDIAGYTAAAVPFVFEDITSTGTVFASLTNQDNAFSLPVAFTFPLYGVNNTAVFASSNGLITFGGGNASPLNSDLTTTPPQAALAPFWDDLHTGGGTSGSNVFFQVLGSGVDQHLTLQWNNVRFFSGGTAGDTITFQAQLYSDGRIQFNYLDLVSGAAGGNNGASATVGIKAASLQGPNRLLLALNTVNAFVGTGKSTLITPNPVPDYYAFTLSIGQTATLAATALTDDNVSLELRNSSDAVLATGVNSSNLTNVINNFTAATGGTYYARIIGGAAIVPYSLVVTRNAAFDTEENSSAATAQTLAGLPGALGAIFATQTLNADDSGWIITDGTHLATNNNYFVGQGLFVTLPPPPPPTLTEFRNYATFSLSAATPTIIGAELRLFNPGPPTPGGYISADPTETYTVFDVSATPDALDATRGAGDVTGMAIHGDLGSGTVFGTRVVSAADNGMTVAITLNAAAVAALNASIGSTMSFGGAITTLAGTAQQTVFAFTTGAPGTVQLVLQTLPDDWYSITLPSTANALRLETSTPGDGPGEPVNTLNPTIDLYDDTGTTLIASGVARPDGRNESIVVTGLTPGATYKARVRSEGGTTGEYFLSRNFDFSPVVTSVAVVSPIDENGTATLTGSFIDLDVLDTHTVVITWGPGEGSTTLNLAAGVLTFSAMHQYRDDNPTGTLSDIYPIGVTVTDNRFGSGSGGVNLTVNNVAPVVAAISGPSSGVRGQALSFSGSFTDAGTLDTHQVRWDFGDGTVIDFHPTTDLNALTPPAHIYTTSDVYTLTLSIRDDDGGLTSVSKEVTITAVAIQEDPCDPGETALVVGGTTANDTIVFEPQGNKGDINVFINDVFEGVFNPTGHILAFGQAGDDDIQVAGSIALDTWLFGDAGNDQLKSGGGASILLGGDGDDLLNGGGGRNILIGGRGKDRLIGGNGDDLLIGGFTAYDTNALVLCALLDGWNSTVDEYSVRVARLRLLLNGTTVIEDGDVDLLIGGSDRDWFFAGPEDSVMDLHDDENME